MESITLVVFTALMVLPLLLLFPFVGCGLTVTGQGSPSSTVQNLKATRAAETDIRLFWDALPIGTKYGVLRAEEGVTPAGPPIGVTTFASFLDSTATGVKEGTTFVYRVLTLGPLDAPDMTTLSAPATCTSRPTAPAVQATSPSETQIKLEWTNKSLKATKFQLQHVPSAGAPQDLTPPGFTADTSFTHTVSPGTHTYRVFAVVENGFEDSVAGNVKSAATEVIAQTSTSVPVGFLDTFTAALTTNQGQQNRCIVQRIEPALLTRSGSKVRITVRASTDGPLALNRITISQGKVAGVADPFDSVAVPTTVLATATTILAGATLTTPEVAYNLDRTQPLLVAFDVGAPGNVRYTLAPLIQASMWAKAGVAEAALPDRSGYALASPPGAPAGSGFIYLVEKIEVM